MPLLAALKFAPWVLLALASGYIAILRANIEASEAREAIHIANTQRLETAVSEQNQRIESYVVKTAQDQIKIRFEHDRANKAERQRDEEIAAINSWRDSLSKEIGERPKVVARAAGLGSRRMFRAIEAATTPGRGQDGRDSGSEVSSSTSSPDNQPAD